MEGNQPGPGWWVASDGQWYPPEQRAGGPPSGSGPAPGSTAWTAPSNGTPPADGSGSGNRTAWAIVAVAASAFVLLGAVGAAVLLLRGGGMDVDAVAAVVSDRADEVSFPGDETVVDIDECLVDDERALFETARGEAELPAEALTGERRIEAVEWTDEDDGDPVVLFFCGRDDDPSEKSGASYVGASFYVGAAPREGYRERTDATLEVSWFPSREVEGGTMHAFCYDVADDETPGCEATWVDADERIVVGLYVSGASEEEDLGPGLELVLADVVGQVAGRA